MPLIAIGINHKTAPVTIREQVAFAPDRLGDALQQANQLAGVNASAILSTCNRTELYCEYESDESITALMQWIAQYHDLTIQDLEPYFYSHDDQDSARHMIRVACGLDSLVLGEPQILGQLKTAYQEAYQHKTLGRHLGRLFQHAFSAAKRIRTKTEINASPVSVAFAAVNLAKQIFGELNQQTVLLIGAGETIELAAQHLHGQGIKNMIVANRTVSKAEKLAHRFNAESIALSTLGDHLASADIVISSTSAPVPVLGKGTVERALKARRHQPMFMVDLAVPRDIEEEVGELDDIYLYTVDDLENVIQENMESRRQAAEQAEQLVLEEVTEFMEWLRAQDAVNVIRQYRDQAETQRDLLLDKARKQLANGQDPALVMQNLAHALTQKLTHDTTANLNQAARDGNQALIDAACELLNLDVDDWNETE